jgi:hypothetical protein
MELDCSRLNAIFGVDGDNILHVDEDNYEHISHHTFLGEKHPLWGTHRTEEQKKRQSEVISNWWETAPTSKKESMRYNLSKTIKSQWDLLTPEERKKARNWKATPKHGKNNPNYGKVSANRGKIWITNGTDNKLVNIDYLPDGWWKGRTIRNTDG